MWVEEDTRSLKRAKKQIETQPDSLFLNNMIIQLDKTRKVTRKSLKFKILINK